MSIDDPDQASLIEKANRRLQQPAPRAPASGPAGFQPRGSQAGAPGAGDQAAAEHNAKAVHIDVGRLRAQGYLTPDGERTRVAEEFRIIKRPLLDNAFGKSAALVEHGNLIMVTSAIPGEGKTYTAMNLAMSIAMEMDKSVLLIDADAGRPSLHELLGTPLGPGLMDLLIDDSLDVGDVMLRTNIPKLRVIPVGQLHAHSTELLASDSMGHLVRELETRYSDRVIIFDSPPLLATSDTVVLSGLAGQVVFVVEAGRTRQGHVKDALGLLDSTKPVGLVLNKVRKTAGSSYYGYGSYGSSYYAGKSS
ncbi:MAG: XrtA-associated tyrosine autokinase [Ectothiorhodospiraceae bacterium]